MKPEFETPDGKVAIYKGNCRDVLAALPENSIDCVVCDPPYGLRTDGTSKNTDEIESEIAAGKSDNSVGFRGAEWDNAVPGPSIWRQVLRAMKPGAALIAASSTRTYHTLAQAAQDAGFMVRDMLCWTYIQGAPKGMDVSKAFDRRAGVEDQRGYIPVQGGIGKGSKRAVIQFKGKHEGMYLNPDNPITQEAKRWHGWNTGLKPALEPACYARKRFSGSLLDNLVAHGVGAINVKDCAVRREEVANQETGLMFDVGAEVKAPETYWPSNLFMSPESREWLETLEREPWTRMFYCPKPNESEYGAGIADEGDGEAVGHPTIKPLALMEYWIRLVVPPGAVVCDPFAGSGTTAIAALRVGRKCILIEREEKYIEVEKRRILDYLAQPALF